LTVEVTRKPLLFVGTSHDDLKAFPDEARRDAGFNLDFVQRGLEPENWKPMKTVGPGVKEIRVRDATGAYRVIYLATRPERFMCCTVSKRRPKRLARWISNLPHAASLK
jgi:phage-related protein